MATATTTTLTPKQEARRQKVIEAALDLGAEGGYEAVQMRDVAARADVALGTIYRYFSSKDHLLASAMAEWSRELYQRAAQRPPRGETAAERLVDFLRRACRSMERQQRLTAALINAWSSGDPGVAEASRETTGHFEAVAAGILDFLDPAVRAELITVIGHVWHSSLLHWAYGRTEFSAVADELERAVYFLLAPYQMARSLPSQ